jgi:glutathione S-transferase
MQHWIRNGLSAYEALVKPTAGQFSIGDQITLADLCLIPQCYSALRNEIPLEEFPTIKGIWERAKKTEACQRSAPENYEPKA